MRLCDTRGEIRAAYSALLEVIPTHVLTRYPIKTGTVGIHVLYMYVTVTQCIVGSKSVDSMTEYHEYYLHIQYRIQTS